MSRDSREWLATNSFGSFALGTIDRVPHRKYHSLLTVREPGRGEPLNLLLEVGEYVETNSELFMLHALDFRDRIEPKGFTHLSEFQHRPSPKWVYRVNTGAHQSPLQVTRRLRLEPEIDRVSLDYEISGVRESCRIRLRPFLLFRRIHDLTHANSGLNGAVDPLMGQEQLWSIRPYQGLPGIEIKVTGQKASFSSHGQWVEKLHYRTEMERGYECIEDAFAPGDFEVTLDRDGAFSFSLEAKWGVSASTELGNTRKVSAQKAASEGDALLEAGEQFLFKNRRNFHSIIAGYPWFGSWGRDTLIALHGLCLSTEKLEQAESILESYVEAQLQTLRKDGVICTDPERELIMTGVDTPLWLMRAIQGLSDLPKGGKAALAFMQSVCDLITELKNTRDGRVRYKDGGLFVEAGPWALTWMDVVIDHRPMTPRAGYAVEINALFYNAVCFALKWAKRNHPSFFEEWAPRVPEMERSFVQRFWLEDRGYLADCENDSSLRPNQLWALAVPFSPLLGDPIAFSKMGRSIINQVRLELLTPFGLRTLSNRDPRYRPYYRGGPQERDQAYHQGTVWPWLLGVYADAVLRVEGLEAMKSEIAPLLESLRQHRETDGCLGQISEVFDGDPPHRPGGTPAQAWSVSEVLRISRILR